MKIKANIGNDCQTKRASFGNVLTNTIRIAEKLIREAEFPTYTFSNYIIPEIFFFSFLKQDLEIKVIMKLL